jgi:hypothetical protein
MCEYENFEKKTVTEIYETKEDGEKKMSLIKLYSCKLRREERKRSQRQHF